MPLLLQPNWPAPPNVCSFYTTRLHGHSQAPFSSFNLAEHVGDDKNAVLKNRALLQDELHLPAAPHWLTQTHSTIAIPLPSTETFADAAYTTAPNTVCVVMTADCLPLLLTDKQGQFVAVIHAGWRGLSQGIIEDTVQHHSDPSALMAWLGPAIGPSAFEVGTDVYDAFAAWEPRLTASFKPCPGKVDKFLLDIYQAARAILNKLGVWQIYGGEHCTFNESGHFFSYRREGQTGRMASLIWMR